MENLPGLRQLKRLITAEPNLRKLLQVRRSGFGCI